MMNNNLTEKEQGVLDGVKRSITLILNKKFQYIPMSLVNTVKEESDEDKLNIMLSNAVSAETLQDFTHTLS